MEDNKLLPIGTVVLLKGATHRLMIMGYTPMRQENGLRIFDYWGCFYPEGLLELDKTLVFDRDRIDKVFAEGYSDDEEKEFRAKIEKILTDVKDEKGNVKLSEGELATYMLDVLKGGNK